MNMYVTANRLRRLHNNRSRTHCETRIVKYPPESKTRKTSRAMCSPSRENCREPQKAVATAKTSSATTSTGLIQSHSEYQRLLGVESMHLKKNYRLLQANRPSFVRLI